MSTPANDNPSQNAVWDHIELSAGKVTSSTIEGAAGVRNVPSDIGKVWFYVDAVEVDGTRLCLASSEDYERAIRAAEAARIDFEIDAPVKDTVAGRY